MKDANCIFCKIADGEIPSIKLYEDKNFVVIFDISPAAQGHAIIISKTHAKDLFELPNEYAANIMVVAKKVGSALMEALNCDGMNILQNNGEAAGQTVFHLHVHLIPRYADDAVNIKWNIGTADQEFLNDLSKKVEEKIAKHS
ncbi:HIT family protein [Anaeromicropila populeti]|uniref:Histidine triad (HIT) family protein n=1 Tax=Anaeromicropila populeti TaxID=37658 RepID=A0A1I6LSC9_9FIRM|nr:HIT family protein [Anaeromicropila populeti]SFS06326.1 histidine triad (HIT) family protein [Anaeromicropila populeti]